MSLTRRQLLVAGGAAALGAGVALRPAPAIAPTATPPLPKLPPPAPPVPAALPPPTSFVRGIDLTPNGVLRPESPQNYVAVRAQPWFATLRGVTTHLRLWADWPTLQPLELALEDPANPGLPHLLALDAQIRAANADGVRVILMPYRYPGWVNGTAGIVSGSAEDVALAPQDRLAPGRWSAARAAARRKALVYRLPSDGHGPSSRWAAFVEALWSRYVDRAAQFGRADAFEVVNEPNLQLWPQRGPATAGSPYGIAGAAPVIPGVVAEMITTMDGVARRHGLAAELLAPSAADGTGRNPRLLTGQTSTPWGHVAQPFVEALLDELDARGFAGGAHWAWSGHAYADVEDGHDRLSVVRARLAGRWRGRAAADGAPVLYVTEAGCRLSAVQRRYGALDPATQRAQQAGVLRAAVERLAGTPGVALLTQYTLNADPNYDCGLLEPDGTMRPAFGAWTT